MIFPIALMEYERLVKDALVKTAHAPRGGASRDAYTGATMPYIKHHGRWQQSRFCLRYANHGRYLCCLVLPPPNMVNKTDGNSLQPCTRFRPP